MDHVHGLWLLLISRDYLGRCGLLTCSIIDNIAWCRRHTFVVNSDDKEGLHWFVCAFDCGFGLERWV